MAISDVLFGFNPMDIVKGYEYGQEKGREREKGEADIARQKLVNDILNLQNRPAAELSGLQTGADIEAFRQRQPQDVTRRLSVLDVSASAQERRAAEEEVRKRTLGPRLAGSEARESARNTPEAIAEEIKIENENRRARAGQAGVAGATYGGLLAEDASSKKAQKALMDVEADERAALQNDPTAPRADNWTKLDRAIGRAQDARASQMIQERRDRFAYEDMARLSRAGDVEGAKAYLKRYGKDGELTRVYAADAATGLTVTAWQFQPMQTVRNEDGATSRGPSGPVQRYSIDALPGILGIAAPPQQQPGRRQATQRPILPRVAQAPAQKPEGAPGVETGLAAAVGPTQTPEQAQRTKAMRSATLTPQRPGAAAADRITNALQGLTREEVETFRSISNAAARSRQEIANDPAKANESNMEMLRINLQAIENMLKRGEQRRATATAR